MSLSSAITAALLSGSVAAAIMTFVLRALFGQLLDSRLERLRQELQADLKIREMTLQSQIDFKERQLSELYGPVYAHLKRGRALVHLWKVGKLKEIEPDFWTLARHTNNEIERLIINNSHLIDGPVIPDSFVRFLIHVPIWHAFMDSERGRVPFTPEEFPEAYYHGSFEVDVYETTSRLKRELQDLYGRFGLLSLPS